MLFALIMPIKTGAVNKRMLGYDFSIFFMPNREYSVQECDATYA